jgi:hypothetical protein
VDRSSSRLLLAAAAIALAGVGGCGDGYSRDEALTGVTEANPELTDDQAACVVDGLIERYGLDAVEAGLAGGSADVAFAEAQYTEMFVCGVEGDVGQELTEQLEAVGVSPEDAPCVSDRVVGSLSDDDVDALLSGDITDELATKFATALEDCGALDS